MRERATQNAELHRYSDHDQRERILPAQSIVTRRREYKQCRKKDRRNDEDRRI